MATPLSPKTLASTKRLVNAFRPHTVEPRRQTVNQPINEALRPQSPSVPAPLPPAGYFDPTGVARIRESLGTPTPIAYAPAAGQFAETFQPIPITGLPTDYFTAQKESLKEQLRQEFFGPTGQAQAAASAESAAGRLGSGVGRTILQETVARPLTEAFTQIDRDVLQAQMQETARVQQFNADQYNQFTNTLAALQQADSTNALAAEQANAQLQGEYTRLVGTLADAEAGRLTQEGIARLDSDTRMFIASQDAYLRAAALTEEKRANQQREMEEARRSQTEYLRTIGQFKPQTPEQQSGAEALAGSFGIQTPPPPAGGRPVENSQALGLPPVGAFPGEIRTGSNGQRYQWNPANATWVEFA